MRHVLILCSVTVALAVSAFTIHYSWNGTSPGAAVVPASEMEWLRSEFNLDADQFERVWAIHQEYQPICQSLCDRVVQAKADLEGALLAASSYSEQVDEKLVRFSRVKEECHRSMLQHVYEVAAVMSPEDRMRYLAMAKAQITRETHANP
jgi:hypothetical protein